MKKRLIAPLLLALATACERPPVTVTSEDPNSKVETHVNSQDDDGQLFRAISVYEPKSGNDPVKPFAYDVNVEIDGQNGKTLDLLLSSYYPAVWKLTGPGVADLNKVVVISHHKSYVIGVKPGQIINRSADGARLRAGSTSFGAAAEMVGYASDILDQRLDSFTGAYNAQGFHIH